MDDIDLLAIGNFIKQKRLEQGLSIRELSAKSNVAAGTISQIETGKTSPNLMSLNAICNALRFPVSALFIENSSDKIKLVRKNERMTFVRNVSNGKELLESNITKGENEMWGSIVQVPPKSDSGPYYYHDGEEFVFILKGTLTFDLENNPAYILDEHDTLYYPNSIGHRWMNESDDEVQMLIVSTSQYKLKE
ncbi:MAG: XRE family transcriptional regulator [Sedimentibacter sp.]|uniref:helix-turn-helix domain-containing protein n=1 Tax=Sedimentibacter sp. TaxID=1960295 RepID=UPI00315851BA